jgi:hypothetical protein
VFAAIGQRHPQQSLMHVLGRAVADSAGAAHLTIRCHGDRRGATGPTHAAAFPVLGRSNGPRLTAVALYSYERRRWASVDSTGPVTTSVPHAGTR